MLWNVILSRKQKIVNSVSDKDRRRMTHLNDRVVTGEITVGGTQVTIELY